jgi:hypothetical protein
LLSPEFKSPNYPKNRFRNLEKKFKDINKHNAGRKKINPQILPIKHLCV